VAGRGSSVSVFHFELRAGIHVAHAFNLSRTDLDRAVLDDWRRGEEIVFGDRRWPPDRTALKIYEGPVLSGPDLAFGRGWTNAVKRGENVTARVLAAEETAGAPPVSPALDALRREILAQCRAGRIGVHQVLWLTNRWYPERRVSERLALAESAVWGLLHERLIGLCRVAPVVPGGEPAGSAGAQQAAGVIGAEQAAGLVGAEQTVGLVGAEETVGPADWEEILLDWGTWADPSVPAVLIEAPPPG
jgi:hypothetical protein